MLAFAALPLGAASWVIRMQRSRSVDARLDDQGILLRGTAFERRFRWRKVERWRLDDAKAQRSRSRSASRTGYFAVRTDGAWQELTLDGITVEEANAIHLWSDWVLGVKVENDSE